MFTSKYALLCPAWVVLWLEQATSLLISQGARLSWQTFCVGVMCSASFIIVFRCLLPSKVIWNKSKSDDAFLPIWLVSQIKLSFTHYSLRAWRSCLISRGGAYTPGTKTLFTHSPYRRPVGGKRQWCIWLWSRYRIKHYWLVNSNRAHLVMLMMMVPASSPISTQSW